MEQFYEGIEEIFICQNDSLSSNFYIIASQILIGIVTLSQSVQMFWYPSMQLQD